MRFSLVALARTVVNTVPKDDVMVRNVHWITGKGKCAFTTNAIKC